MCVELVGCGLPPSVTYHILHTSFMDLMMSFNSKSLVNLPFISKVKKGTKAHIEKYNEGFLK